MAKGPQVLVIAEQKLEVRADLLAELVFKQGLVLSKGLLVAKVLVGLEQRGELVAWDPIVKEVIERCCLGYLC